MSIFPSKILLATDGSRESELAARTADSARKPTQSVTYFTPSGSSSRTSGLSRSHRPPECALPKRN